MLQGTGEHVGFLVHSLADRAPLVGAVEADASLADMLVDVDTGDVQVLEDRSRTCRRGGVVGQVVVTGDAILLVVTDLVGGAQAAEMAVLSAGYDGLGHHRMRIVGLGLSVECGNAECAGLEVKAGGIKALCLLNPADVTDQASLVEDHLLTTDLQSRAGAPDVLDQQVALVHVQAAGVYAGTGAGNGWWYRRSYFATPGAYILNLDEHRNVLIDGALDVQASLHRGVDFRLLNAVALNALVSVLNAGAD